jgi:hypothetical protein
MALVHRGQRGFQELFVVCGHQPPTALSQRKQKARREQHSRTQQRCLEQAKAAHWALKHQWVQKEQGARSLQLDVRGLGQGHAQKKGAKPFSLAA